MSIFIGLCAALGVLGVPLSLACVAIDEEIEHAAYMEVHNREMRDILPEKAHLYPPVRSFWLRFGAKRVAYWSRKAK